MLSEPRKENAMRIVITSIKTEKQPRHYLKQPWKSFEKI